MQSKLPVVISDSLAGEFLLLHDAKSVNRDRLSSSGESQSKYSDKTLKKLKQHIVCRNYANLSYEFAHLCWVLLHQRQLSSASSAGTVLFHYFYLDEVFNATQMKAYFSRPHVLKLNISFADIQLSDDGGGIVLSIYEHRFVIRFSRANILSAFFEWMLGFIDDVFTQAEDTLSAKGLNGITSFASYLQKQIYEHISTHISPVKAQAKYQFIQGYLDEHGLSEVADDQLIPLFKYAREQEGMQRIKTLIRDLFQFEQARRSAQDVEAASYAATSPDQLTSLIAPDDESEVAFHVFSQIVDAQLDIEALTQAPKLLSKQQSERLSLLAEYPLQLPRYPLRFLRFVCLGDAQAKVTQAQRLKKVDGALFELEQHQSYLELIRKCRAQLLINEQSVDAVMHLLSEHAPDLALSLLTFDQGLLQKTLQKAESLLQISDDNDVSPSDQKDIEYLVSQIFENKALKKQWQSAYQQNNRQGFTKQSMLSDASIYMDSAQTLLRLNKVLTALLTRIEHILPSEDLFDEKYRSDGFIFLAELNERMKT